MKIRLICLMFFILPIFGCWKTDRFQGQAENIDKKDTLISFFDFKNHSRKEISGAINNVNDLGAEVVGLNVIFDEWRNNNEDTLLAKSIFNCDKIILAADVDPKLSRFIGSNSYFVKASTGEGVISYLKELDGSISGYIPLLQIKEGQRYSFPYLISYYFRSEIEKKFQLRVNQERHISFHKTLEDFNILDEKNLRGEHILGKIIIFGDLEISGDQAYLMYDRNHKLTKVPSSVVVANIILTELSRSE